jgi:hypothetical protein
VSLLNPSFEEASSTLGVPSNWNFASVSQNVEVAGFVAPQLDGATVGFEAFEWFDALSELADVGTEGMVDDFESGWANTVFLEDLIEAVRVVAEFDTTPQTAEDFEEEWSGNEGFAFDWSTVVAATAQFDTTPQGFEDFEEEWRSNETFVSDWGSVVSATAQFDTTLQSFEDFEEEWIETMVTV